MSRDVIPRSGRRSRAEIVDRARVDVSAADASAVGVEAVIVIVVRIVELIAVRSRAAAKTGWMQCGRGLLLVELVRRRGATS